MLTIFHALLISLGLQLLFFIPAYFYRTDKLTDFTYGLTFLLLTLIFFLANQYDANKLILVAMITIWAIRLVYYLVKRIRKIGKDTRFDETRENLQKFAMFWFFQGIIAWIILIPTLYYLNTDLTKITPLTIMGILIWGTGLIIETLADKQKFEFKNKQKNKNKWTNTGLWKYSRHPNYLGEILVWTGIYLYTATNITNWHIALISPLTIYFTLRYISGIPILEKKYGKKYSKNKAYKKYKKQTGILLPKLTKS